MDGNAWKECDQLVEHILEVISFNKQHAKLLGVVTDMLRSSLGCLKTMKHTCQG